MNADILILACIQHLKWSPSPAFESLVSHNVQPFGKMKACGPHPQFSFEEIDCSIVRYPDHVQINKYLASMILAAH
jgi:hypothetical protein